MRENKNKSMILNAILSSIKTLNTILFPLITYPYITRVLSVENIGRINFGQSIVSYFALIAAFGINTYAIRNGSRKKDDPIKFNNFVREIFTINIISTVIACALLLVLLCFPTKISEYRNIILIQAITVAMLPFSLDWLYTIFEDFGYITLRSFLVQLLSLCLMFIFVKNQSHVYLYVLLTTIANCLGNIFNFIHSRKYVKLKISRRTNWNNHKSSLFIFFINSIASTIYLNSGTTILGLLSSDYSVGLYSVASKIYMIVKQVFNAVIASTIPRLAYLQKNSQEKFEALIRIIVNATLILVVPASLGLVLLRSDMIIFISGLEYIEAATTLGILAFAILFAVLSNILANGILICIGKEGSVVKVTTISAFVNIICNIVLVPFFRENAAAISTVFAELIVVCCSAWFCKDIVIRSFDKKHLLQVLFSSLLMCFFIYYFDKVIEIDVPFTSIIIKALFGGCTYFVSLLCMKNELLNYGVSKITDKLKNAVK